MACKENRPIVAIMYDFDKTLSPRDMQEYALIPGLKMEPAVFWDKCNQLCQKHNMDQILAYMYALLQEARGKMLLTREVFQALGESVQLFPGVEDWFARINRYGETLGVQVEHYIISSGLKEIIEGTSIAGEFQKIYAAEFCYDDHNVPVWPAMAVNYTSKTQFLFRINKGVLDVREHNALNGYTPDDKRRVPFRNMIYVGDGLTDVPCMKLIKSKGGRSIAVYQSNPASAQDMLRYGRVDYVAPADYRAGSRMEQVVFALLEKIRAVNDTISLHLEDLETLSE